MDFKLKAGAGGLRLGVAKDVIFVVAPDEQPTCPVLSILDKLETLEGARPPVHYIAGHNHQIRLPRVEVGRYGPQRDQIGMNIG
jgi:hypothetical protein